MANLVNSGGKLQEGAASGLEGPAVFCTWSWRQAVSRYKIHLVTARHGSHLWEHVWHSSIRHTSNCPLLFVAVLYNYNTGLCLLHVSCLGQRRVQQRPHSYMPAHIAMWLAGGCWCTVVKPRYGSWQIWFFFAKCGGKLEEDAARGPAVCGSWWQSVNQKKIEIMPLPYGHSLADLLVSYGSNSLD